MKTIFLVFWIWLSFLNYRLKVDNKERHLDVQVVSIVLIFKNKKLKIKWYLNGTVHHYVWPMLPEGKKSFFLWLPWSDLSGSKMEMLLSVVWLTEKWGANMAWRILIGVENHSNRAYFLHKASSPCWYFVYFDFSVINKFNSWFI